MAGAAIIEIVTIDRGHDDVVEAERGDRLADAVRADEDAAAHLGIRGVPFFVLGRRYGVSGAQPTDIMLQALRQAWDEVVAKAA
jgi:predicted DsbA family dithiol-disulfide isomerase